ncbi:MAG: deoxyribodipyrimidine photo-lyase, partial [Dokdonella sp.]
MTCTIVWFRRDLRLVDNPALDAAVRSGQRIVPVYIHAPEEEAPWPPGAASNWWLHHSLIALDADLRKHGSALHVARGPTLATLRQLVSATNADSVHWNRLYEPALIARDKEIKAALRGDGTNAESHNANLLFEPWTIATNQDSPYRVFTPFWRKARAQLEPRPPIDAPKKIASPDIPGGLSIDNLGLLPTIRWDRQFGDHWQPGEAGAQRALDEFCVDALADYPHERDIPSSPGTSRLSPHLHFGEIGPMQIVWAIQDRLRHGKSPKAEKAAESYIRELGWREFSHHLLFHFPHMSDRNLDDRFKGFSWAAQDDDVLRRWQRGDTGIPIIDAGMRELWATGWMHNRVRMLVASFLTKNLRQHWLHGARWFWDTLVDADLAN